MMSIILLSIVLIFIYQTSASTSTINVYTNCNGLDDGYYDIEVIPGQRINVLCSNEYMIIDIHHDSQWSNVLSSNKRYHQHIIGSELNDHVNWDSFLPALDVTNYLVSPDCSSCDASLALNQEMYGEYSAYYMNQIANGCFHKNRGLPACDMDPITYECKICQWTEGTVLSRPYSSTADYNDDDNTGICAFMIKPNNFGVATEFTQCLNYQHSAFKPSSGTNGKYCQCIKTEAMNHKTTHVYRDSFAINKHNEMDQNMLKPNDVIYLDNCTHFSLNQKAQTTKPLFTSSQQPYSSRDHERQSQ